MNSHFCSLGSKLASGIPDTGKGPVSQKNFFGPSGHSLIIVMLYGITAPKHVLTNCKSCKIVQHGLSLGLIILCQIIRCTKFSKVFYLEKRGKRHLLVTMFKVFNKNCPTLFRSGFIEPLKFTTII